MNGGETYEKQQYNADEAYKGKKRKPVYNGLRT